MEACTGERCCRFFLYFLLHRFLSFDVFRWKWCIVQMPKLNWIRKFSKNKEFWFLLLLLAPHSFVLPDWLWCVCAYCPLGNSIRYFCSFRFSATHDFILIQSMFPALFSLFLSFFNAFFLYFRSFICLFEDQDALTHIMPQFASFFL